SRGSLRYAASIYAAPCSLRLRANALALRGGLLATGRSPHARQSNLRFRSFGFETGFVRFQNLFLSGPPTFCVRLSGLLAVGHRAHSGPNFNLFVALDRRFGRSAAFLAPNERDLSAGRGVFVFEDT